MTTLVISVPLPFQRRHLPPYLINPSQTMTMTSVISALRLRLQ